MEADTGHCADSHGTSFAPATHNVNRSINPNRFRRADSIQAGTDWLFGRAVPVLQISHHVC